MISVSIFRTSRFFHAPFLCHLLLVAAGEVEWLAAGSLRQHNELRHWYSPWYVVGLCQVATRVLDLPRLPLEWNSTLWDQRWYLRLSREIFRDYFPWDLGAMGYHTIKEGDQALVFSSGGQGTLIVGPRRVREWNVWVYTSFDLRPFVLSGVHNQRRDWVPPSLRGWSKPVLGSEVPWWQKRKPTRVWIYM